MADLGLLTGISEGFKQGLQSYQEQKQRNFNNRIMLAEMMSKGFQTDPDGNIAPGEGLLAQQKAGLLKSQHDIESYSPDSDQSINATNIHNQILKSSNPGRGIIVPPGMSAADLNAEGGPYKTAEQGGYAMQAGQIKASAMSGPGSRVDEMKNQNASHAGNEFEKTLKPYRNVQNSLDRAMAILKSDQPLTRTQLNVAKQDYVNSVAQGGQATEGKANREIEQTMIEGFNAAMYKAGEAGDLRKVEPGIVNNLSKNIGEMKGEWQKAQSSQAADLADNYSSNTNGRVKDTVKTKLQRYAPDVYAQKYGGQAPPSALGVSQQGLLNQPQFAPDVLNYAKSHNITPEQAQAVKAQRTGGQ